MNVEISFDELCQIIVEKTGKSVILSYGGDIKRLRLNYGVVNALIRLDSICENLIGLSYQIGDDNTISSELVDSIPLSPIQRIGGLFRRGVNFVAARATEKALGSLIHNPAIERLSNGKLLINLSMINLISKFTQYLEIADIIVNEQGIVVTVIIHIKST